MVRIHESRFQVTTCVFCQTHRALLFLLSLAVFGTLLSWIFRGPLLYVTRITPKPAYQHLHMREFKSQNRDVVNVTSGERNQTLYGFPPLLHQIFLNYSKLPESWQPLIDNCLEKNSNLQRILWDRDAVEDLIKTDYSWFYETFQSYRYPVQRADTARYIILHRYGGVYLDMDTICHRPISEMISRTLQWYAEITDRTAHSVQDGVQCIVPQGTAGATVTIHMLICKPRSDFMAHLISSLKYFNHHYIVPYLTVVLASGPHFATSGYARFDRKESVLFVNQSLEWSFMQSGAGRSWQQMDGYILNALFFNLTREPSCLFIVVCWCVFFLILCSILLFCWVRKNR